MGNSSELGGVKGRDVGLQMLGAEPLEDERELGHLLGLVGLELGAKVTILVKNELKGLDSEVFSALAPGT